jgi:C-terminal processing protease CtpA/Prc
MKLIPTLVVFALTVGVAFGQLTLDQKVADFNQVGALYSKRYGPYEWKRDVFGFDLLNATPWLDKIAATKDDLDFYEVLSEYVSKLNDAHDAYTLPSNFQATLNFSVDLYDGKLLVDSINRTILPATAFPFSTGYELISIDGQDAKAELQTLLRYQIAANPRSTSRFAALLLTIRPQQLMPHAANVPETSTVVFRDPDAKLQVYTIPWTKSGLPLTTVGKYPTPTAVLNPASENETDQIPPYLAPLIRLQNSRIPDRAVVGFGSLTPVFASSLPSGFTRRLGATGDPFFSGVFESGGFKIGFIRIPSYSPANTTTALTAFQREMAYFQTNTDGLVIDDTRNPGGSGSYVNQLLSLVMPTQWRAMGFEVRATSEWVISISSAVEQAKAARAPQDIINLLETIKAAIVNANASYRGRTQPIPLDDVVLDRQPATDSQGNVLAYTKPLIVLIDEMSASAAEVFAAGIQDNARGPLVGWRTMGAGGNVEAWEAGSYSLGTTTVTESLMNRGRDIFTNSYPASLFLITPYVENVGVLPDVPIDYMTVANLSQAGKPFVDAFVTAIINEIRKGR